MSEQSEVKYLDGEIVWVKLGSCWWPSEVVAPEKLPSDLLSSFRKPPIAIVKFFQEDAYEYVKNENSISKYECSRKIDFIKKGLYMYRTKHGLMEKFPDDVIHAETSVGGDPDILSREEFQEPKRQSYAGLFGDPRKTPSSVKKGKSGKSRQNESLQNFTPTRKMKEKTDYKVHILVQGSKTPCTETTQDISSTPSTSGINAENNTLEAKTEHENEETQNVEKPVSSNFSTPLPSSSGIYACHACPFTTTRLNVLILHNKTHSLSFMPYTPSPVRKKTLTKKPKSSVKNSETRKSRILKADKAVKKVSEVKKRPADEVSVTIEEIKKTKTDEEIKSSLLADWDDIDEDSNDESSTIVMTGSPEVGVAVESPAVPTPAEVPSAQVPADVVVIVEKKSDDSPITEKAESSSDSKYEFCEDEDWTIETDAGRKIPRVKNPKRKDEAKSLDEDEVAREVADILSKTNVPELPSVPEPLKAEENFPEPPVVKSPDKSRDNFPEKPAENPVIDPIPTKAIFKTKTFFRSRHSRSQDAIGKYVAEQLNAVERMDISESEINGSDAVSSPEARDSPPIEPVKVARLAPKIQLKKMKAEAAQLREKEKNAEISECFPDDNQFGDYMSKATESMDIDKTAGVTLPKNVSVKTITMDVLYPTQEIKPINADTPDIRSPIKTNKVERHPEITTEPRKTDNNSVENQVLNQEKAEISISKPRPEIIEKIVTPKKIYEPRYMNESTASAVDALLSVSREADRVTRVISNDPPEDLFEDDNKDSLNINGNYLQNMEYDNGNSDRVNEPITNIEKDKAELEKIIDNNIIQTRICSDESTQPSTLSKMQIDDTNQDIESNDGLVKEVDVPMNHTVMPIETVPSESDLQIAETLINLPSTAIQSKPNEHHENLTMQLAIETEKDHQIILKSNENVPSEQVSPSLGAKSFSTEIVPMKDSITATGNGNVNYRYETEQEKSENLNAAKSLVQMSETIDHQINIIESNQNSDKKMSNTKAFKIEDQSFDSVIEQKVSLLSNSDNNNEPNISMNAKIETATPKLLKILEKPCLPKVSPSSSKQIILPRKENILNFDVAKSALKGKAQSTKQKIIIRRTTPNKNVINNMTSEISTSSDKIILSRTNNPAQDPSSVQTYTIKTSPEVSSDANTIIIQQKIRKVAKPPAKLQKIRPQNSLIVPMNEKKTLNNSTPTDDTMFDINSMPIVLSEDLLTAENIEKMPVVMSGNSTVSNPSKLIKTKITSEANDKVPISATPTKPEVKTLLMNPVSEVNKVTTPNILSKSSKLRGAKPMLVIDKTTGKQKIIMTKPETTVKETKQAPTVVQSAQGGKTEKFIILPTPNSPRPSRTQKIVIDPQTGKTHVLVSKGPETTGNPVDNKPVSAKLLPSSTDATTPGNTVMIITNAQGAQSRILLTPEHEKILFPNKQQPNVSQLKSIAHRLTSNTNTQKTVTTIATTVKAQPQSAAVQKTQTRIVPKQKSTIITSKGQLIVGGRVSTTAHNIAPMPEIRPAPKRIVTSEPKKIVQTIHKTTTEPLIFLQQKSGTMMQLTAAQFEHLQKTGQIVQKPATPAQEKKILIQKSITIPQNETAVTQIQKSRARKQITESPAPLKKIKQEIAIAPAPSPNSVPMPVLAPLSSGPSVASTTANAFPQTTSTYTEYENFEELLPSTAIAKQVESVVSQPEQATAPLPAPLADSHLLAVPGEPFGGPPGSFYLCVEDNGTLTPIDNRPLILENNQLVPMAVEPLQVIAPQPERRDILEAALANSDVFHADTPRDDAPDFRDLNANVSVHCRVSETSSTLNQPIMTPVEMPTKADSEPTVPSNLEDGLAVIGVTPHTVPTSLELPITVTDPRIAPKMTDPLSSNNYGTTLLTSPNTEMTFVSTEESTTPMTATMSMPLLNEDDSVGKSMPILTDDIAEKTISSVESNAASPSSGGGREAESEDSAQWTRRLFTPGSDISETSAEIPLQPSLQLSVNEASRQC